jgi:hypothetical protein
MEVKSLPLLFVAALAGLIFLYLLIRVIAGLLRSNHRQIVATGPLLDQQQFELSEASPLLLLVEVPRFGCAFRQLQFEVIEKVSGRVTRLGYDFLRAQGAVYGVTTMRVPIGRLSSVRPGRYLVRVLGLNPETDYSKCRLMLSRPYLGRMVLQIIGIVVCGIGLLLSLLLGLWQVLPLQQG